MVHPELPGGVKDPLHPHSRASFRLFPGGGHRLKNRIHGLLLPQHYSGGKDDFRVLHVLVSQPLDQSRGDECVILRRLNEQGHDFKCYQELAKVPVSETLRVPCGDPLVHFLPQPWLVLRELKESFRTHRPFQMQVQLHFGQASDERGEREFLFRHRDFFILGFSFWIYGFRLMKESAGLIHNPKSKI